MISGQFSLFHLMDYGILPCIFTESFWVDLLMAGIRMYVFQFFSCVRLRERVRARVLKLVSVAIWQSILDSFSSTPKILEERFPEICFFLFKDSHFTGIALFK